MKPTGFLCGPRLYEFEGWFFEESACNGPWPLLKNGEPRKRAGRKFWQMWKRFAAVDKRQYCVGGGCQEI